MKKRVFLSFMYEDESQVNGLRLLAKSPKFPLEFYDESIKKPINSTDSIYLKIKIIDKIKRSSAVIVLIGNDTYKSQWVNWEIEKAIELEKKVIGMALKGVESAKLPTKFPKNSKFYSWDPWSIEKLIG
ncbi:MAG TPA: TIR domain-containing protein [Oligoflexia bacterium]|nr:TIR domain-containing protein [Oligoflexia bacterium]HMR25367.1 TIR domain-containing protein [Oligoflexia bacterium]